MSGPAVGGFESPDLSAHDAPGHEKGPHVQVFAGAVRKELDETLKRYPTKMAALLPALWIVQRERGWVSDDSMAEVAEVLELTPAYVKGVASFYTMYHKHPVTKYFIQVCTTSPCEICGADEVVKALLRHTRTGELGVPSPDGKFTVIEVECLGACGFATPIMINDDFIESVTAERVPEILKALA